MEIIITKDDLVADIDLLSGSIFSPIANGRYVASLSQESNQRQTIQYDASKGELRLKVSRFLECPLFYFIGDGVIVISDCYTSIRQTVEDRKLCQLEVDRVAIAESLIFDNPLRDRTWYSEIKSVLPDREYLFDAKLSVVKISSSFELKFHQGDEREERYYLDEAVNLIDSLPLASNLSREEILLPLSGGYDSRLLAALLKRKSIDFKSMTFGPRESIEPFIAKKIAKMLGVELRYIELKDEYYEEYGAQATALSAGYGGFMHSHIHACLSQYGGDYTHMVHGYMGDVYSGGSQKAGSDDFEMTRDEALSLFIERKCAGKAIWVKLNELLREEILNDLNLIMDECLEFNFPCHFDEYVHNVDRQYTLITNVIAGLRQYSGLSTPFASDDYANFFNTLPAKYRYDRVLFNKASHILFKDVFSIGNNHQYFELSSLLGRGEKVVSKLVNRLSYASCKISNGRYVLPNPKGFERHRQLLYTTLSHRIEPSVQFMEDLLSVDKVLPRDASGVGSKDVYAVYRSISNHSFLK